MRTLSPTGIIQHLLSLCGKGRNIPAVFTAALLASSCGAQPEKSSPNTAVTVDSFLGLERAMALEEVRTALKMPGMHEFAALIGDTEYLCLHFLFQEPRVGFYLLFTNAHLKAIVGPPAPAFERIPYKDTFREIPKPFDPEVRLQNVLATSDLTRDEIKQEIARAPTASRTPSNIEPAVLIALPFFIARSGKIESDYRTNEELAKKYDPFKIRLGADMAEITDQFGQPYRVLEQSRETMTYVYGSPISLRINPSYRFSWVTVVVNNGKVVRVLSNHFVDRRLLDQ